VAEFRHSPIGRVVFRRGRVPHLRPDCAVELFTQDVGVPGVPVSVSTWTMTLKSSTSGRGHQGAWPVASIGSALLVASECSHVRR
jgi:hypothetical protein